MMKYYPGAKPYCEWEYWVSGTLTDPGTTPTCAIYDHKGKYVSASETETTTKSATGIYYYEGWTIPTTALAGKYTAIAKITDGDHITRDITSAVEFEVIKVGY